MFETLVTIVGILLVIAAVGDMKHFKIPNWIPTSIALLYGIAVALSVSSNMIETPILWLPSIAISAILLFGFTALFALGHMGGGDTPPIILTQNSKSHSPSTQVPMPYGVAIVAGGLIIVQRLFIAGLNT